MKLTGTIAERYVSAVERENERTRIHDELVAAQYAHALAQTAEKDAAYRLRIARQTLEDFEAEQK